ncbi:single-stranded DNA-binding protein, partial [bacterium]|nr:single-stranded DNA-binding protein [bacterium]NUN47089.1 single-stranded DNA-binding protein [bacterium]
MNKGSLNRAVLIGRLGRDPQVRYTPTGTPITSFSVATTQVFK